jgi:hypothetical protein
MRAAPSTMQLAQLVRAPELFNYLMVPLLLSSSLWQSSLLEVVSATHFQAPKSSIPDCVIVSTAVLFYLAKKREWKVRESIRRSARKVVTALTPRRSEFPRSVKESSGRSSRGRVRLDEVPPTPKLRPEDIEKGLAKSSFRQSPEGRGTKWARK